VIINICICFGIYLDDEAGLLKMNVNTDILW